MNQIAETSLLWGSVGALAGVVLFAIVGISVRIDTVMRYRQKALEEIFKISMDDSVKDSQILPTDWRYDLFDEIGMGEMMLKFWKPVDTFFAPEMLDEKIQ